MFLLGPIALSLTQHFTEPPSWVIGLDPKWLSGGYDKADLLENLSLECFESEAFQASLETEISNNVPRKSDALLFSAGIQRQAIASSNVFFDWPCYPTFFGSSKVYIPDNNALGRVPYYDESAAWQSTEEFGKGLSDFASNYPEVSFTLFVADISECSLLNPAVKLSSSHFTTEDSLSILNETLAQNANVSIYSVLYDNLEDYYSNYYTTDHHWNGFGAMDAYNTSRPEPDDSFESVLGLSSIKTNGSNSREGLMLLNEPAREPNLGITPMTIEGITPPFATLPDGARAIANKPEAAEFDFYHTWYGPSDKCRISSYGDGRALVVCDSFGSAMQWLIANDHESTLVLYDMHVQKNGDAHLVDTILSESIDHVYFISHAGGYAGFIGRFPYYFRIQGT